MQKIIFDLSKNEAEIKSVDGELAEGNVGSVELHIINAPNNWGDKTVWATFIKGEVELPCITSKENNEYVTPVPDYIFIDDRNFGIYVWCVGGQNYIETRRVLRIPVAETGTFKGETVKPETISSVDQLLGAMQTLATAVENAEKDRYQMYYTAEGISKEDFDSGHVKSRQEKYIESEIERNEEYFVRERQRESQYIAAEGTSDSELGDDSRWGKYKSAEQERYNAFTAAETQRKAEFNTNEIARQSNERQRINAETDRQNAETERKNAEQKREETINSLSVVATSGNYNDLNNKPIIESTSDNITHDYNEFTTEGIYILREPYKERYKLLIVTTDNDHYDNETNTFYGDVVAQYLFSTYGVTKRMQLNDKWTGWEPVGGTDINVVDDIDSISGDEEKKVVPSARAVKIHTTYVLNAAVNYVDRNVLNKFVNDLTVPVEADAIPTARCTQKYIQDTSSDVVAYVDGAIGDIETSLENIIAKYGLGGDGV